MDFHIWAESLREIRKKAGFDFAGMASVIHGRSTLLVWRAASGNRNKNYLKIVLEPGKGVAGGVFRREKPMVVQDTLLSYSEDEIVHSPILLAEDLRSFAAFPLWQDGKVESILLLAMRREGMVNRESYDQVLALLADGIGGMEVRPVPYEEALERMRPEYRSLPIYELVDVPVRAALREERHRIAQDLHDSVIQDLLGVQMQLRTLKYAQGRDEMEEGLRVADESLSQIQTELREILASVKPGIVEDLGLAAAFRQHFRFLESSHGIDVEFRENAGTRRFSAETETVVYRICQEATANACKYSGSSRIEVDLLLTKEGELRLEVRDGGSGFDTGNLRIEGGGMGLPGMHYWASSIGGDLTVRAAPGKGTSILLVVPAEAAENSSDKTAETAKEGRDGCMGR